MFKPPFDVLFCIHSNRAKSFISGKNGDVFVVFYLSKEVLLVMREVGDGVGLLKGGGNCAGECRDAFVNIKRW